MNNIILFKGRWSEDDFSIIIPTTIKEDILYVFEATPFTPVLVAEINNIEKDELNSFEELKRQLEYLTLGVEESEFPHTDLVRLKNSLINIGNACKLDAVFWCYENLMEKGRVEWI